MKAPAGVTPPTQASYDACLPGAAPALTGSLGPVPEGLGLLLASRCRDPFYR